MDKKIKVYLNPKLNWKTIATSYYKIHHIGNYDDDNNNNNDFNYIANTIRKKS